MRPACEFPSVALLSALSAVTELVCSVEFSALSKACDTGTATVGFAARAAAGEAGASAADKAEDSRAGSATTAASAAVGRELSTESSLALLDEKDMGVAGLARRSAVLELLTLTPVSPVGAEAADSEVAVVDSFHAS